GVQGLMDGLAVVIGKGAEHRLAKGRTHGVEVEIAGGVAPFCADRGAEESIFSFGQCGERVFDEAFKTGVCRLEQNQIVEARKDVKRPALRAFYAGCLEFAAAAHEGAGVRLAIYG